MKESIFVSLELGELIKRVRKGKGFRQEDLADDLISTATISNIERGAYTVSKSKLEHICSKLGLDLDHLSLPKQEELSEEEIRFELVMIEHDIDACNFEHAWKGLQRLSLENDHPLLAWLYYLRGKYYLRKKVWNQASVYFSKGIQVVGNHPEMISSNIQAACYNELSRIAYYQNDLEQAIQYVKEGLSVFVPNREREYYQYHLMVNKVIYLKNQNRVEEALRTLNAMWKEMEKIKSTEVLLNMYELQAELLNKTERYEEATTYALAGMELARIEGNHERLFDLWTVLGSSYIYLEQWKKAEQCLRSALRLKDRIKKEYLLISTYTQLGKLYSITGKMKWAISTLEEAVRLGKQTNDVFRLCEALEALGDSYLRQNQYKKARRSYESALLLAEQHFLKAQAMNILLKLACCCQKDDPENYQKYIESFFQMHIQLQERREIGMKMENQIESLKLHSDPPGG
ncbi:helix-turn-helix domain-containing protein [Thermoflavimicrobium dichotomicum]|uniref:Soluble NSF attachment protein, SNAP n=1 Tax=Thermoflavimicrobium dichotomicum TaxID=46223 RepID=A0A1I3MMR2_9BACL|nr:helix-turn-helix domain-containing protein [Thermoflavimicrobium dichotomicum]SFI98287.1 Soluble NSF attachment protein, SNAP [Thermoflavimicrobium dichotomicum]